MGFAIVNIVGAGASEGTFDSLEVTATALVEAGDLVVIWTAWGADIGVASVTDGTSTFEAATRNTGGAYATANGQYFYLLAAVATGFQTYTLSCVGAFAPKMILEVWRPSAPCVFDADIATGSSSSSTSISSGALATTGADELVVAGAFISGTPTVSAYQIGGGDASLNAGSASGTNTVAEWYLETTGVVSATATLDVAHAWLANAIAFKIATGPPIRLILGPH